MSLPVEIGDTVAEVSAARADALHARIAASGTSRLVLGVPAGRTLAPVVEALAARLREAPVPLDGLVIVLMDDYALRTPEGGWRIPAVTDHYSCRAFGEQMRQTLNAAVAPLPGIPETSLWSPDPQDPAAYDARIAGLGGVDVFYVAVGASDGHVAFNPPGSAADSRTRIIPLAESTRRDNLGTFPGFATLDDVPTHGVSVGIASIADAREIEMLAFGDGKAEAVARLMAASDFDAAWPATFVHRHTAARLFVDRAAAANLAS